MKLLEAMYRGYVGTFCETKRMGKDKKKLVNQLADAETELLRRYPDAKELYSQLQGYQGRLNGMEMWEEFRRGFRVGAQLMAEMMEDVEE